MFHQAWLHCTKPLTHGYWCFLRFTHKLRTTLAWPASSSGAQLAMENSCPYTNTHSQQASALSTSASLLKETITLQKPTGRQAEGDFLKYFSSLLALKWKKIALRKLSFSQRKRERGEKNFKSAMQHSHPWPSNLFSSQSTFLHYANNYQ